MNKTILYLTLFFMILSVILSACAAGSPASGSQSDTAADGKLKVVATTSIVGDVAAQVGGEHISLSVLLPVGSDPHSFDPTPQDVSKVAEADLVLANGAGLEAFLDNLIESAGGKEKVIYLSDGIDFREPAGEPAAEEDAHDDDEHGHEGVDPHTWNDPNNVIVWVENIRQALDQLDPDNSEVYSANAAAYTAELQSLDVWIREQVSQVPEGDRNLVTDHQLLGYFADEYGFTQVGALISGYSSLAEPTAKELADLEDTIRSLNVKAVFVGKSVNPTLAERVAADTGTRLVYFYTGSLSEAGGEVDTYLKYMRYNVTVIVNALKD